MGPFGSSGHSLDGAMLVEDTEEAEQAVRGPARLAHDLFLAQDMSSKACVKARPHGAGGHMLAPSRAPGRRPISERQEPPPW